MRWRAWDSGDPLGTGLPASNGGSDKLVTHFTTAPGGCPNFSGSVAVGTWQAAAGLEVTAVEGRWLDNAAAGPIYVISGELLRAGSRPAEPGAWLAVRLFDEDGLESILKAIQDGQGKLRGLHPQRATLEDVFLEEVRQRRGRRRAG